MRCLLAFVFLFAICAATPIYPDVRPDQPLVRQVRQFSVFGGGCGGWFGDGGGWDGSNQNLDISSQSGLQEYGGLDGFGVDQYRNVDIDYSRRHSGGPYGGFGAGFGSGNNFFTFQWLSDCNSFSIDFLYRLVISWAVQGHPYVKSLYNIWVHLYIQNWVNFYFLWQ